MTSWTSSPRTAATRADTRALGIFVAVTVLYPRHSAGIETLPDGCRSAPCSFVAPVLQIHISGTTLLVDRLAAVLLRDLSSDGQRRDDGQQNCHAGQDDDVELHRGSVDARALDEHLAQPLDAICHRQKACDRREKAR